MEIKESYKNLCCIYCIKNTITNTVYIGQTSNLYKRLTVHRSSLKRLTHNSGLMNQHSRLYGIDSFEVFIIKRIPPEKYNLHDAQRYESTLLDSFKMLSDNYYNKKYKKNDYKMSIRFMNKHPSLRSLIVFDINKDCK